MTHTKKDTRDNSCQLAEHKLSVRSSFVDQSIFYSIYFFVVSLLYRYACAMHGRMPSPEWMCAQQMQTSKVFFSLSSLLLSSIRVICESQSYVFFVRVLHVVVDTFQLHREQGTCKNTLIWFPECKYWQFIWFSLKHSLSLLKVENDSIGNGRDSVEWDGHLESRCLFGLFPQTETVSYYRYKYYMNGIFRRNFTIRNSEH